MWLFTDPKTEASLCFARTPDGFAVSLQGDAVLLDTEDAMSLVAALTNQLALVTHEGVND